MLSLSLPEEEREENKYRALKMKVCVSGFLLLLSIILCLNRAI